MTVTSMLSAAYEKFVANPLMDLVLGNLPTLQHMRRQLLTQIPRDVSSVLEVGPGTGLNFPCYPDHVTAIETLSPLGTVPESLMAKAAERGVFVRHHTYLTLDEAKARGLLRTDGSHDDEAELRKTALRVATALGIAPADLADPRTTPCMFPFASRSQRVICCTLVLCTIPLPVLPWYLAEVARVLAPGGDGRYYFLEHIVDGDPARKSAAWRAFQTVQSYLACGCDVGRTSLDALKAALLIDDYAVYCDERAWIRASYGLLAYGSARSTDDGDATAHAEE
ncbi:hypothetical protein H9P43_001253 [Blastocladiella emersonii ATCC 22665]|nr:hypothetical protein H9P43_001253 [Blastocladiella emersonii ATCC 22665]